MGSDSEGVIIACQSVCIIIVKPQTLHVVNQDNAGAGESGRRYTLSTKHSQATITSILQT